MKNALVEREDGVKTQEQGAGEARGTEGSLVQFRSHVSKLAVKVTASGRL